MLVAIISDIHANLEALEAVRRDIEEQGADCVLCAGDIVGYGANPNECVEMVREMCADGRAKGRCGIVLGNHDDAAVGGDISLFNAMARTAVEWTRKNITVPNRHYLERLELALEFNGNILVAHASPHDPHEWHYITDLWEVGRSFRWFRESICFIGHTHVPFIACLKNHKPQIIQGGEVTVDAESRYLINVGSVGQPRDGNPAACYGLYDTKEGRFALRRVAYPVREAAEKIIEAGLPSALADRLAMGW